MDMRIRLISMRPSLLHN